MPRRLLLKFQVASPKMAWLRARTPKVATPLSLSVVSGVHGTMPEDSDQVMYDIAGDAVDAELSRLIRETCPGAQFSEVMVKEIKERHSFLGESAERVIVELPVDGKPTPFDLTDQIRKACSVLIAPIVEGVRKLVATFDPEFQTRLKNRVLLAGGGSMIKGLDTAIEKAMKELAR